MVTKKNTEQFITLPALNIQFLKLRLRGDSPLAAAAETAALMSVLGNDRELPTERIQQTVTSTGSASRRQLVRAAATQGAQT